MMADITLTSEITVEPIQQMGSDTMIAHAAMVSTRGRTMGEGSELTDEKRDGLLNTLMSMRHGTPFEHGALTVRVHAPIKVWREWHRHRIGWCLAGDTEVVNETFAPRSGRTIRKRRVDELWRNWHHGVPDSLGRVRLLASCRNLPLRVLNEQTNFFEIGRMSNIVQSGVKEVLGVSLADGKTLKCSKDHQILTSDGWVKAGELSGRELVGVVGKRSAFAGRQVPPALRRGIGVWTSMQRTHLIKPDDNCYVCGAEHSRDDLLLDHVVAVAENLSLALDTANLKPICRLCNRRKTDGEQKLARRCNVAGSKWVKLKERPGVVGEEMTYDISMEGPHHNFVANGIVVHNSYNEESGRYKQLDPVFYIPPPERPAIRPEGFKSMRPAFDTATAEEYASMREALEYGYRESYDRYEELLRMQVDRGLARDVLGVGIYSSCYCTANPRSIMAFLELRTDHPEAKRPSKPLYEIRVAADKVEALFASYWPVTHHLWVKHGRMAP